MLWVIIGAVLLVGIWLVGWIGQRPLRQAIANGDAAGIAAAINQGSPARQLEQYHQTIRTLWDAYQRETAICVIRAMAERHKAEKITQYWLHQAVLVEPQLSLTRLDDNFLAEHYLPEVAATCGSYG